MIEELVYLLIDNKLVSVKRGECKVNDGASEALEKIPAGVNALLISKFDKLSPSQQLLLKVKIQVEFKLKSLGRFSHWKRLFLLPPFPSHSPSTPPFST